MELLLASSIGVAILLAIGQVDMTRTRLTRDIGTRIVRSGEASLATVSIIRDLERADRVRIMNADCSADAPINAGGSCVHIRIPDIDTNGPGGGPGACPTCTTAASPAPCCFDIERNYRWVQYRFNAAAEAIQFYDDMRTPGGAPSCGGGPDQEFVSISGLGLLFVNESALAPPGGDPLGGPDNNMVQVSVRWRNPADPSLEYVDISEVALRGVPYSAVTTGLDVGGICLPPAGGCS